LIVKLFGVNVKFALAVTDTFAARQYPLNNNSNISHAVRSGVDMLKPLIVAPSHPDRSSCGFLSGYGEAERLFCAGIGKHRIGVVYTAPNRSCVNEPWPNCIFTTPR
jgi:hypothetical protein